MNIAEPIFMQCRSKPAEVALCAPGTEFNLMSYGRLARSVNNVCRRVISAGLAPQTRAAVFIDDPILHAIVLIALTRLGVVTISGRGRNFAWPFAVDVVISDRPFQFPVDRVILADYEWASGEGRPPEQKYCYRATDDDLCRIFLTSGTTGEEKGVAATHSMIAARIDRQNLFFGPGASSCSRTYLDLSLTTSLGYQVLLATLWRGGALIMSGDPELTIKALPIYGVQNMVGSPRSLFNFTEAVERRAEYRSGLQAVFTAGSALPKRLARRVRSRVCSNLTTGYGSTEATMVASMPAHYAPDLPGAAGYLLPGVDVEIVDDDDRPVPAGNEGIVRIRSEHAATEYLDDAEESGRAFRNGWFHPGDLGYITKDNILVISGRATSVVNLGGEKTDPGRIEEVLSTHATVVQAAVHAVATENGIDELYALVVPRSYLNAEELRDFCKERLPSVFVPTRFIAVADLPRNQMGKIERAKLADLIRSKSN